MVRAIFWNSILAILLFSTLLGAAAHAQQASGPQLSFIPGIISTVAGNPSAGAGYSGDGGPATAAQLNGPAQISFDPVGNYYLADFSNNVIRFVNIKTGNISTVAGGGTPCAQATDTVGDGCPATSATLAGPTGVTLDASGNLYIADGLDAVVRRVDAKTGIITTVVGTPGTQCPSGTCGDGGLASNALLIIPRGVFVDPSGNLYVADQYTNSVREVSASTGIISTFAGTTGTTTYGYSGDGGPATSAQLSSPFSIAEDPAGNFYIADSSNNVVRKVDTTGTITTFVSGLNFPTGVSIDLAGDILIAENGNNAVRKSDANGNLTTVAGGSGGFGGDGGPATSAQLNSPYWVVADSQGNLYVADNGNNAVREVSAAGTTLPVPGLIPPQTVVGNGNGQVVTVSNTGNATLQFTGLIVSSGFSQQPSGGTDCTSTETLAPQASCQIGIVFSPTQLGMTVPGTVTISSNAGNATNGTNVVSLVGSAQAASSTALSESASSIGGGQGVTFTATVTPGVAGTPTGTVTFTSGSTVLGAQTLSGGVATLTVNTLPIGASSIVATYGGDTNFLGSTSAPVQLVVTPGAAMISLTASPTAATPGQPVTFTAVVTSGGPVIPTGSVTFMDGTVSLGTFALDATGTTAVTTSSLPVGADSVTAVYSGDTIFGASSSAAAGVTVSGIESSTVLLTVSNTSLTANQPLTLQASVGPTTYASPTGTVTFMNGTSTLATGTLNSDFRAISLPYLAPGNYSFTVVYSGDANFSGSTSASVQVVVTGTPVALLSMSPPVALTAVGDITGTLPASPPNYTGPVTGLVLTSPTAVVTDASGNLYILDNGTNIWVVASGNGPIPTLPSVPSPQSNTVYQVAGQGAGCAGQTDSAGDGCLATEANFNASGLGLAIDSYGNLFLVDTQNNEIRVIYGNGAILGLSNPVPGFIYQVSCTAAIGSPCRNGLFAPQDSDIWVDPFENIYIADDNLIEDVNEVTVNYSSGQIPALGPGLTSGSIYNIPSNGYLVQSIGGDPLGNIYFGDDGDQLVQGVYTAGPLLGVSNPVAGQSYTVAGNGSFANGPENNVPATSAGVGTPGHLAADSAGNLYIPDYTDGFVFKVDSTGNLTTTMGTQTPGCAMQTDPLGDGCLGAAASLSTPYSVALDPSGDLFIADNGTNLVRELSAQTSQLTFGTQAIGTTSPVESVTISNPGAAPLSLSAITVSSQFAQAPSGGTDCSTSQSIPPGGSCQLGVVYAPTQSGSPTGTVTVTSNANGTTSTNTIMLTGTTVAANNPVPTLTSLQPASAPAGSGAFTLTVNGTNFVSGSVVNFNGNAETTTYVSATEVTAAIQSSDITSVGTPAVTVTNPTPGGGTSNALTFTISAANNPAPTITSLQPASAAAGSGAFTLTVNGTNFISGSVVNFNGNAETTTYVSATEVTAAIQASDITSAGATAVTVTNPAPGGGASNALTFTINAAGSAATFTVTSSTSPQTVQPGGTAQYSITVTAQNGTFSNPVTLAASGLPSGATATFSSPSVTPGGGSASSQLSIQTSSTTAALAGGESKWVAAATLPFFGLFFLMRRHRRRWSTLAVLLLASLGAVAALSGCGTKKNNAHSYTITITGTSGAVAESTTVQLTVE